MKDLITLLAQATPPYTWKALQLVLIQASLLRNGGNKSKVALELGISIRNLRDKCKKL